MAAKYNEKEKCFSAVPAAPPPPHLPKRTSFKEGKNLMKSAATLLGNEDGKVAKQSAFNMCQNFLRRNLFDLIKTSEECHISWYYHNNDVEAHLQDGPTCGLVALKLAADMLRVPRCQSKSTHVDEIQELLNVAQENGFTYRGEMFSARDMGLLAKIYYELKFEVINNDVEENKSLILVEHLCKGYPVLVPYDADRNYEPCLKRGHKAHWAVITGFLIGLEDKAEGTLQTDTCTNDDVPSIHPFNLDERIQTHYSFDSKRLFVLARQGKSRHYTVWSWNDLDKSNKNLNEFNQAEFNSKDLPLGESDSKITNCIFTEGVQAGLCSKVVFLFPYNSASNDR